MKLRRFRPLALLAFAACAGKAPSAAVTSPLAKPAATADGEVDPHYVANQVKSQLPAIKRCYDDQRAANPSLAGKVVMRWTIDTDGATRAVAVDSEAMPEPAVSTCIVELIKTWRFRAPSGGSVEVSFPLVFETPGDQRSPPVHP